MVDPALWAGFVLASLVIGLTPGPGVAAITGYALGSGERTAFAAVAGLGLGNFVATAVSLAGMGAVLAASATAFLVLKWAGAAYLVGLGLLALRDAGRGASGAGARTGIAPRTAFAASVAIGTFHPKTIVFMAAFAPQFVARDLPYAPQAAILAVTFALVCMTTDGGYALLASRARRLFGSPQAMARLRRAGGGALILAGIGTALARR